MALPPVSYSIAEARGYGLVDRSPHWKTSPAHMLYQRAMGRGGAMYFPELLAGLESPPDDTDIPPERHLKNITDLFDNDPSASTPTNGSPVLNLETGEFRDAQNTPEKPREGGKAVPTTPRSTAGTQGGASGLQDGKNTIAPWRTTIEARLIDSDALRGVIPPAFYTQCLAAFERPTFSDQAGGELVAQLEEWILAAQDAHDDEEPSDG